MRGEPRKPPAPVLVIDANKGLEDVQKCYAENMSIIMGDSKFETKDGAAEASGSENKESVKERLEEGKSTNESTKDDILNEICKQIESTVIEEFEKQTKEE